MDLKRHYHTSPPIFDGKSMVLILGTFPSVRSREANFFYHHPQNRFWKVIAKLTGSAEPKTIEQKRKLLLDNRIAVWDVVHSCRLKASSDSSIRDVVPNDLSVILDHAPIEKIFANGNKAYELYMRYSFEKTKRPITRLPSTSPANARWSLERLLEDWKVVLAPDTYN
ncbi:MAG: DNA-deoxyinosine glycosylase [Clostridiales bacterium]|nr:DNA-deoxyinosine glycosylase [Clostridiales bacterium]